MEFVIGIYKITQTFPSEEKFGIISQMRRCSVSVSSNIAEGSGRESEKEFKHFISISLGSAFELETQIIISQKLEFITEDQFKKLINEIRQIQSMLIGLKKKSTKY
jgi:four helix bundle protein